MKQPWNILNENITSYQTLIIDNKIFYGHNQLSKHYNLPTIVAEIITEGLKTNTKENLIESLTKFKGLLEIDKHIKVVQKCITSLKMFKEIKVKNYKVILKEDNDSMLFGTDSWDKDNDKWKKEVSKKYLNSMQPAIVLTDKQVNDLLSANQINFRDKLKSMYMMGIQFIPEYNNIIQRMGGTVFKNPKVRALFNDCEKRRNAAAAFFRGKGLNAGEFELNPKLAKTINSKDKYGYILVISKAKKDIEQKEELSKIKKQTSVTNQLLKLGYSEVEIMKISPYINDSLWATKTIPEIVQMASNWMDKFRSSNQATNPTKSYNQNSQKQQDITNAMLNLKYNQVDIQKVLQTLTPQEWEMNEQNLIKLIMQRIGQKGNI